MRRRVAIFLAAALAFFGVTFAQNVVEIYDANADPWWRAFNPLGQSYGVSYGRTRPSAPSGGEIFVDMDGDADGGPVIEIYDGTNDEWNQYHDNDLTFTTLTVGTADTIAKFNSGATDLADSQLTDDGTDVTLASTAQFLLGDGSSTVSNVRFGADNDAYIYWANATPIWVFEGAGTATATTSFRVPVDGFFEATNSAGSGYMLFDSLNAANAGFTQLELYSELVNIDDDTISIIKVDASWADNPTGGNLRGLDFATPAPDANTTETAIYIVSGWDYGLTILGDGSATTNNITLGGSQTADAQIYFDGANFTVDLDGATANDFDIDLGATAIVQIEELATNNQFLLDLTNAAGEAQIGVEMQIDVINELTSDVITFFLADLNDTEFDTASGSTVNFFSIEAFTPDANVDYNGINIAAITGDSGTETAITIGAGWEFGLSILGDGSAISNNITLGAGPAQDAQLYFDGGGLVLDTDGAAGNDIELKLFNDFNSRFQVGNSGVGNYFETQANTSAGNGNSFYYFLVSDSAGVNGSDMTDVLQIEWNDTSWATGTGNELRGVNVDDLTADADVTNIGLRVGTGWDIGIKSAAKRVDDVQTETCLTGGGACTFTLTPTSSYVEIACQDANSCDGTMSETGAVEGQILDIVIIEEVGATDWADDAGVLNIAGAYAMGIDDTLRLRYTGALWVEVSRSDN